jgi:hypothetical protein
MDRAYSMNWRNEKACKILSGKMKRKDYLSDRGIGVRFA